MTSKDIASTSSTCPTNWPGNASTTPPPKALKRGQNPLAKALSALLAGIDRELTWLGGIPLDRITEQHAVRIPEVVFHHLREGQDAMTGSIGNRARGRIGAQERTGVEKLEG